MTVESNYTNDKDSKLLLESGALLGKKASAYWYKEYLLLFPRTITSHLKEAYSPDDMHMVTENKDRFEKEAIPAYTVHDLWSVIPEWVKKYIIRDLNLGKYCSAYGIACEIEIEPWKIEIKPWDIEAVIKYYFYLVNKYYPDPLIILTELVVYLAEKEML